MIHALRVVTEDRSQDPDRADQDHDHVDRDRDRANRDHDHVRNRDHIVRCHDLENALDRAVAGNRQVDLFQGGEQGQDRALRRSTKISHVADQSQTPERVVLGPDENRDPKVAPNPATGIVIETGAARDRLPLSKSHGRNHDPHHPDGDHAAVLGLYQNHLVVEVVLGRELPPQVMLTSKM